MRRKIIVVVSVVLMLMLTCLSGCGYVAGNYPPPTDPTVAQDSTKVITTVDGKRYRCINRDGTWKCVQIEEALAKARRDLNDPRHLDASER